MGKWRYKLILFESYFGVSWSKCLLAFVCHNWIAFKGHRTRFGKGSLADSCNDYSWTFASYISDTGNMAYLGISKSHLYICTHHGIYICINIFTRWIIWNCFVLDYNNWILYSQPYSSSCRTWTCLVNAYLSHINYILYF